MTSFHGGKQRIGKELAEVINTISKDSNMPIKGYCEPFCGMLGVYQHIPKLYINKSINYIANDINKSTVMMWEDAQQGWEPPTTTTEEEYQILKISEDCGIKGYIGHQYSFGGQFFNGYAPKYGKNINSTRASKNVVRIAKELKNVEFYNESYECFSDLKGYVIYCDPPYEKSLCRFYANNNETKLKFDSNAFYDWCREMSKDNIVIISSYTAPDDFDCIWTKDVKLVGRYGNGGFVERTEKLYICKK